MTIDFFERFRSNLERNPDAAAIRTAAETGREDFTYRQVAREFGRLAVYLRGQGIGSGDAVGILMENDARWGLSFLAVVSAGAVAVPLDVLHDPGTLAGLISHADCKFLFVAPKFVPAVKEIQRLLPEPLPVLVCGGRSDDYPSWQDMPAGEEADSIPLVPRGYDEPLIILYTSGTTGNPKGVVLTARNVYRNVAEAMAMIRIFPQDHFLSVLPLYHVLALIINLIIPLFIDSSVTFMPVLDAQRILKTIRDENVTIFVCVPQFYHLLHRRIFQEIERQSWWKRFLFRRLFAISRFSNIHFGKNPGRFFFGTIHERFGPNFRLFGVGGARLDLKVAQDFRDLGFGLVQAYGMSETAALISVAPPVGQAVGSVGRPLPHFELRIDEPDEQGVGEILVCGENVMLGYWKNPEATAEAMRDGWLCTGDLGYIDPKGWLHVTGRKKDVIVLSSGKNIYPEEIEHFYQSNCPLIKEMCVLGVPDPQAGAGQEMLHAVVVPDFNELRERRLVNAFSSIRWDVEVISQQLPPYKRVHSFEIRTEPLPRTTTRKLQRFKVQQELSQKEATAAVEEPSPEPTEPVARVLYDLIRRVKDARSIRGSMNLELDLGFTSLERAELVFSIQETFHVRIPDDEMTGVFTVDDLVNAVLQRVSGEPPANGQAHGGWHELLREPLGEEEERILRERLVPSPATEIFYYVLARIARAFFWLFLRFRVRGLDELPSQYPFLICPNHLSFIDAFLVISTVPFRVLRRMCFLGDTDHFAGGFKTIVGRMGKVILVHPDRGPQVALRLVAEGLSRGLVLCVFPEGERSIDGKLKEFRPGPSILAAEFGVPIVPAGIRGAYEVWPRGSNRIHLHPVSLEYGKPLPPPAPGTPYEAITRRLHEAVRRLAE